MVTWLHTIFASFVSIYRKINDYFKMTIIWSSLKLCVDGSHIIEVVGFVPDWLKSQIRSNSNNDLSVCRRKEKMVSGELKKLVWFQSKI